MQYQSRYIAPASQLYWVADNIFSDDFPPVYRALRDPDGLLAIGGDLTPERVLQAYRLGIFPWYSEGQPVLWWSPNPRCVLELCHLKVSRSLAKTLRKGTFRITFNQAFHDVINACAHRGRRDTETWITPEIKNAYCQLHAMGHAVSVESWAGDELAGGLYGVAIGRIFFGESMFSFRSDASKAALVGLVNELRQRDYRLIDCQVYSSHLRSLGASPMQRELFINILEYYCELPGGDWPRADEPL